MDLEVSSALYLTFFILSAPFMKTYTKEAGGSSCAVMKFYVNFREKTLFEQPPLSVHKVRE